LGLKHQHVCGRHGSGSKRVCGWRRRIDEVASTTDAYVGRVALNMSSLELCGACLILLSSC
jgi:hypothetical protein